MEQVSINRQRTSDTPEGDSDTHSDTLVRKAGFWRKVVCWKAGKEKALRLSARLEKLSPTGVEPVTFGSGGQRSIQLSYGDVLEHYIAGRVAG